MLVAKLFAAAVILLLQARVASALTPAVSPKGPDYCNPKDELLCKKKSGKHVFCNCHKEKCQRYDPANMTAYRQVVLNAHNELRNLVATKGETDKTGFGKPMPEAADMIALSYNYVMEDAATCNAKRCKKPLEHDGCHATPQYHKFGGGGQNLALANKESLECKWAGQPVRGCDVNVLNKWEALTYSVIKAWYDEFKDLANASVLEERFFSTPSGAKSYGHMTQVLWALTEEVGCGTTHAGDGKFFWISCNYWPNGNIVSSKVYTVGAAASKCPADKPSGQMSQYKGLCGLSELPPAPPADFFFSPAPKPSPMGSFWPFVIGIISVFFLM